MMPGLLGTFLALTISLTGVVGAAEPGSMALQTVEQFTGAIQNGTFQSAVQLLSPQAQTSLSAARLEAIWRSLPGQLGALKSIEQPYILSVEDNIKLRQSVHFTSTIADFSFVVNPSGQITEFTIVSHVPKDALIAAQQTALYVHPDTFTEIKLEFGVAPYRLPGVLTLPKGDGPFPVVVLVHGSGPNDMDETIGPNKPFRDIAGGLASRGIAVFRYDKRTFVHWRSMTDADVNIENETLADAISAVRLMAEQPSIDRRRIFLLGHSMGGTLAPMIAERESLVAGVIIMAGAARPLYELVLDQNRYLALLDGEVTTEEQAQITAVAAQVELLLQGQAPTNGVVLGVPTAYWQAFRTLDPVSITGTIQRPALILQGERDYQVTMTDFLLWKQGLQGVAKVTLKQYPGLNHLFVFGQGAASPQEYMASGHMAAEVISDLANWVLTQ